MRLGEISANPPEADHCSNAPAAPASSVTRTSRDEGLRMKRRITNRHRRLPDATRRRRGVPAVAHDGKVRRVRGTRVRVMKVRAAVTLATVSLMAQAAFAQDSYRQTVVVTAAAPVELGSVARTMT